MAPGIVADAPVQGGRAAQDVEPLAAPRSSQLNIVAAFSRLRFPYGS
jgi:hypothetical protein